MEKKLQLAILRSLLICLVSRVYGNNGCVNKKDDAVEWLKKASKKTSYRYPGEWFTVNCGVNNMSVIAELWQGKSPGKQRIPDGKKLINNNNIFNITNATSSDSGKYYCRVCDQEKKARSLNLIPQGRPYQRPNILPSNRRGLVHFGEEVTLLCSVNGHYGMGWYRFVGSRKTTLDSGTGKKIPGHRPEEDFWQIKFTIKRFSKSDEGLYICKVERVDVGWKAETNISLKMRALTKPVFRYFPEGTINVTEGGNFNMSIVVDGSPPPLWSCWVTSKDKIKKELPKENRDQIILNLTNLSYLINNGSQVSCKATNMNGMILKSFCLNVLVKPTLKRGSQRKDTLHLKQARNLTCSIYKSNPAAIFNWTYAYENNKDISKWLPVKSKKPSDLVVDKNVLYIIRQSVYKVFYKCTAKNYIGNDSFIWEILDDSKQQGGTKSTNGTSYLITSIVVSAIIVLVLLFIIVVLYKRKKTYGGFYIFTLPPPPDYISNMDQSKSFQEQSHKLPYLPEWEFPNENVTLLDELGSGAFGVVYLADVVGITNFLPRNVLNKKKNQRRFSLSFLTKKNPYVLGDKVIKTAVKSLKDDYNDSALADIRAELKILIHIGEHENILKILGACTKGVTKPLIILEYCPHGSIREFLRKRRDIYTPEWHEIDNVQLSITDLVVFATQISKGMEFLVSRKCIHRDLAARNVLISERYVAKVSDFGMARDVYEDLEYVKKTSGLLPLKWMAIESIRDRIFNEKTDVWSYGIVIWEIFTLGGTPYPGVDPTELLRTLEGGKRMDAPMHCPDRMADVMKSCWYENPETRPSFSSIVDELEPKQLNSDVIDQEEVGLEYRNLLASYTTDVPKIT